ncbi:hypothetical protein PUMCH_001681 [Australozyma saopauloensis]|uniref:Uncharacterized protein n=1 Tax=Australozyma saopauloensis TaxID=291208 RepID=A0AAX4H7F0_9ASCO|nr:hypothetical protein PUMCH_001681 [[Candida] saopauloensis]
MTAVLSPLDVYTRRVSFNNIEIDDSEASNGLSYAPYSSSPDNTSHAPRELEVNKFFGNYSMSGGYTPTPTYRKKLRLPEPPSKLILKNKLTPAQLQYNIANAASMGIDLSPTALQFTNGNENAVEDSLSEDEEEEEVPAPPSARRKLLSQLTDEELMALDPQFSKPNSSNLDNFKFDSVTTYYSPARRASTGSANAQAASAAAAKLVAYPSLNENNYKSISLTLKHQDYDYQDACNRTLLSVISGRKHTWNSLDWLLLTHGGGQASTGFLQDGDYLVVAALVPYKYLESEGKTHLKKKNLEDTLYKKCDLILRYIVDNLPDALLKLRITVELIMDVPPYNPNGNVSKNSAKFGTKFMISHLFKQYNPSLVILGNRSTNLNFKYPLRLKSSISGPSGGKGSISSASGLKAERENKEFLIKISSYMVKYSTVPVILVGNATIFHKRVERKQLQSVKFYGTTQPSKSILDVPPVNFRKNSAVSDNSIESFTGGASSNDQRSENGNSLSELKTEVNDLLTTTDENRFAAMVLAISLSSLQDLNLYLALIKDDSVDRLSRDVTSSRVHQAYISSSQGKSGSLLLKTSSGASGSAYRVKSLILYSEEEEKKNEKILTEKKLRKSVSRSSVVSSSSAKTEEKKTPKKRSFLLRIGLKKS